MKQFEGHPAQGVALIAPQTGQAGLPSYRITGLAKAPKRATNSLPALLPAISNHELSELWSALAERSGDSALGSARSRIQTSEFATNANSEHRRCIALPVHSKKKENQCQES